jgi:hypothetical protein
MGDQLTESNARQQQGHGNEHPNHTSKGTSKVNWFAKAFPQFFTDKVIANRKASLATTTKPPQKRDLVTLVRKIGKGQTGFIHLEKTPDGTMKFHCDVTDSEWKIQPTLLISMAVMPKTNHISDWAGIRIPGREDITVNRAQLLTALRFFGVLTAKERK